jgi:hypothetical protein
LGWDNAALARFGVEEIRYLLLTFGRRQRHNIYDTAQTDSIKLF